MSWTITGAQKVNWDPSLISTALWLDAADASTITESAGAVSQWNDKSGNGKHLTQGTATYLTSGINGLPALSFNGTSDTMATTTNAMPTGNSARSMFAVYKPLRTTNPGKFDAIAGQSATASFNSIFAMFFTDRVGSGDPYFSAYANDIATGVNPTISPKIGGVTHDGTTVTVFRNGFQDGQAAKTLNTNTGIFRVGSLYSSSAEFAYMLFAEAVCVNYALTASDRQKLEGYLAHKWGLTANLPSNHPYKVNPPAP